MSQTGTAQEFHYRIVWRGDSIGYVTSNRKDSLDFEVFKIESRVSLWIFGTKNVNYDFYSVYYDDKLIKGSTLNTKNQSLVSESQVYKTAESYFLRVDGEEVTYDGTIPIKNSVITLYHREPIHCSSIFSERYGRNLTVEKKEAHHYSIEKPNGRSTDYYYVDGLCQIVEVDNFFARFRFELIRKSD